MDQLQAAVQLHRCRQRHLRHSQIQRRTVQAARCRPARFARRTLDQLLREHRQVRFPRRSELGSAGALVRKIDHRTGKVQASRRLQSVRRSPRSVCPHAAVGESGSSWAFTTRRRNSRAALCSTRSKSCIAERFANAAIEHGIPPDQARRGIAPDNDDYWRQCLVDPAELENCRSGLRQRRRSCSRPTTCWNSGTTKSWHSSTAAGRPMPTSWRRKFRIGFCLQNLYGVDLSPEACGDHATGAVDSFGRSGQTLASLSRNIVHGNSLVHDRRCIRRGSIGANGFRKCSIGNRLLTRNGSHAEPRPSEPRPLGSESRSAPESTASLPHSRGSGSKSNAHSECLAYFITFHAYGSWLHGTEPQFGRSQTQCAGYKMLPANEAHERSEFQRLKHKAVTLNAAMRGVVEKAIREACDYRGWRLHAIHVRSQSCAHRRNGDGYAGKSHERLQSLRDTSVSESWPIRQELKCLESTWQHALLVEREGRGGCMPVCR